MTLQNSAETRCVFGFPITPFKSDLSRSRRPAKLADWMCGYAFAQVAAGGTGEIYSMTVEENTRSCTVVKAVVAHAGRGRRH
jgi:dihydrodipicolinate synthase/N-acetylneuraminate lyase